MFFFFFSSRRRHTRYWRDWSSDVCSSDLLAPVAAKLGIDLVWFGVLICVNMQTSFMHPPFGFALFYLRGIAPREVRSRDIYWGAVPWVAMQLILVVVVIFWPGSVTYWLGPKTAADPAAVEQKLRDLMPGLDLPGGGLPGMPDFEPPKIQ